MSSEVLFSVIIPVYNAQNTIQKTLESILNQDISNYEVILINDGSTDNTRTILNQYEHLPYVHIIDQDNKGVSVSRNTALNISQGKYIVFVDADDLVTSKYLSSFDKAVLDADMVVSGFEIYDKNRQINEIHQFDEQIIDVQQFVDRILSFRDLTSACWNKCFQKSIIDQYSIRFNENLSIGEDLVFLTEYVLHCKMIKVIDSVTYTYIITTNNAMSQSKHKSEFDRKWLSEWVALKETENLLISSGIISESLMMKKVRVCNKLLNVIKKFNIQDDLLKKELKEIIRKYYVKAIFCRDFTMKQKLSITKNRVL